MRSGRIVAPIIPTRVRIRIRIDVGARNIEVGTVPMAVPVPMTMAAPAMLHEFNVWLPLADSRGISNWRGLGRSRRGNDRQHCSGRNTRETLQHDMLSDVADRMSLLEDQRLRTVPVSEV